MFSGLPPWAIESSPFGARIQGILRRMATTRPPKFAPVLDAGSCPPRSGERSDHRFQSQARLLEFSL